MMDDTGETAYRCYAPRLRAYSRRFGLRSDRVDDALQETFARLLTALAERRIRGDSVGGWLFQTARNVFVDALHEQQRARRNRANAPRRCAEPAASERAVALEVHRLIRTAMHGLPDSLRFPLLLRHERRLSYREIGDRLGITENAAGIRIHRARALLRARLKDLGLTEF